MNDQKLLELAAKAIGGEYDHLSRSISFDGGFNFQQWSPLEDDGDAFRLATNLHMMVNVGLLETIVYYSKGLADGSVIDIDPRRAITRAAAEIGRAMK